MESLTTRFEKEVFNPYVEFLRSTYRIHPDFAHVKKAWEEKLTMQELVNGPYLEKSQMYAPGDGLDTMFLHEKTRVTINHRLSGRSLYKHQTDALKLILNGQNAVIATGTSSGKTLCYQIPILDDLLRDSSPGLRAIIIYPLNALVNDQLTEWEEMLRAHTQITFARFTGQTPNNQKDYEVREKEIIAQLLADEGYTQNALQREVQQQLQKRLNEVPKNRLNHREAIRNNPPHILITNFSMLEYLLERPVDAPVFHNARLKYLVLDEAHAYRGVQATEIAFLVRRLKDRLGLEQLISVATSATLGDPNKPESREKVRQFAAELFGEPFAEPNPIYGTPAQPDFVFPSHYPMPQEYIEAVGLIRAGKIDAALKQLGRNSPIKSLNDFFSHDQNLYRLRKEILKDPILLHDAAKLLWADDPQATDGLQALLEIAAFIKQDQAHEDLLPTRLHYFVRAQDGLHVCLNQSCPRRRDDKAAYFVSRKSDDNAEDGKCTFCNSLLVEVVTCRKCGYLYGALQDLGPRRKQSSDHDEAEIKPAFDSFSTELGWAADSFWTYFSVEKDLPFPKRKEMDGDEEDDDKDNSKLFLNPVALQWCVTCGKKKDKGEGDNCKCADPKLRSIQVFHRQCPADKYQNLDDPKKRPLTRCPNCMTRNASGLEPVRRFQESDDETGLAMALPLSHFQVTPLQADQKPPRKLLCFTDHRQRAAAFPVLLEEETFAHDLGRKIVEIANTANKKLDFVELGKKLADAEQDDPDFFLPTSRMPDEKLEGKEGKEKKTNLWIAETFAYFGIPDSARESAEDLGLVRIEYEVKENEQRLFHSLLKKIEPDISLAEATAAMQTLLMFLRQKKIFTLPPSHVSPDDIAFGRVDADISITEKREGSDRPGWLPKKNQDGSYRENFVSDYLRRLFRGNDDETYKLAETIWKFLTHEHFLLIDRSSKGRWKLDHERLFVTKMVDRFVCNRCSIVTAYSVQQCCPRNGCKGQLEAKPFEPANENIIARWVAGKDSVHFTTLKSEEHTAQLNKDFAKRVEDSFRGETRKKIINGKEEEVKLEGVNLLSSTTTFEMGINIGDLQKVLLRNAPPSSASYVQRVGRAGRGKDKNAVCVTLCRRTKYDADVWRNPRMLMSGIVRTPTVFTQNRIIAQRHFNAVVFARFLRMKVADEKLLGEDVKQQIPLAAFLSAESLHSLPENWLPFGASKLRFIEWLVEQSEAQIFSTLAGRRLLEPLAGFVSARENSQKKYEEVTQEISKELQELLYERKQLFSAGKPSGDIDRAIQNLLSEDVISVLAKRGLLPRYAFPLDTVTLETTWSRWDSKDVELSRDRMFAISEFAPGAQVIARKKVYTSAGLYIVGRTDKPDPLWYSKCPDCEQIRTSLTKDPLLGHCEVCQKTITGQHVKRFVEPKAFSIQLDKKKGIGERLRRTTLIRMRQSLTHFIDSVNNDDFTEQNGFGLALKSSGKLFRYNLGMQGKGFVLCGSCGHSEAAHLHKSGKKHQRLRPSSGGSECQNEYFGNSSLAYGHRFESHCLIVRPDAICSSVESLAYAMRKGMCNVLEIEPSDIGVSWRWRENRKQGNVRAEIVLYDLTPGGAGFVKEGQEQWTEVIKAALDVCEKCDCKDACYNCLKDYSNQSHHEKLSRQKAIESLSSY
ncbi:MAG: DEAD/DEAH box helicase [Blastocatellia bacterium]|nr:DEAD/DEAH box helicase [Blastocatellia bacterium]